MQSWKLINRAIPALGLAALAFAIPARSQVLVTSPGALGPTDSILWGQLGPTLTNVATGASWTSTDGATGEVGIYGSGVGTVNMQRRDQGNGWDGNFTPGDQLMWNEDPVSGPADIGVLFNTPVSGAGAQIQSDMAGAFTGTVFAEIVGGGTETFTEAGVSNSNADGSAIFIGIQDPTPDILFLAFGVTDINGNNTTAIDTVFFTSSSNLPGTPEPGPLAMFAGMAVTCGAFVRRKRRSA